MAMLIRWMQRCIAIIAALSTFAGFKPKTATVTLYTNPSSGYSWECSFDKPGVLTLSDSYFKESMTLFSDDTCDGKQYFIFRAVGEGSVNVYFRYVNSRGSVASRYVYTYNVSPSGRITLIEKY